MGIADALRRHPRPEWRRRPEILLQNNTVKPLHKVVPRVILGKAWWEATRQAAFAATDFHCAACGVHKGAAKWHRWLEGHEVYRINYRKGRMTYVETVALCHSCHNFIHDGRLKALLDKAEITEEKYFAIMEHGEAVLKEAGLKKLRPYSGPMAKWEDWRLVLFGEEYPPIFKNYEEWLVGHGYINDE